MLYNINIQHLMEEISDNVSLACYKHIVEQTDLSYEEKDSLKKSSTASEAQTIVFNNIVSSDAMMEYYNYSLSGANMYVDNNKMYKTEFTFNDDSQRYSHNPMWMLYEVDEYAYEDCECKEDCVCPEISVLEEKSVESINSDYVFSEDAKVLAKNIIKELDDSPFYHEVFHWKGIDNLLNKKEKFLVECNKRELKGIMMDKRFSEESEIMNDTKDPLAPDIEFSGRISGLKYLSMAEGYGFDNQKAIMVGYKTPMGIASYVMFDEADREEDFGRHFDLKSTGTIDCFQGKGLSSNVIQNFIKNFKNRGEIFVRSDAGNDTPEQYTQHLDRLFEKGNQEGSSVFVKSEISKTTFRDLNDLKKKDMINVIKKVQEKSQNMENLERHEVIVNEKKLYLQNKKKTYDFSSR